jgi:hypothetical protein
VTAVPTPPHHIEIRYHLMLKNWELYCKSLSYI